MEYKVFMEKHLEIGNLKSVIDNIANFKADIIQDNPEHLDYLSAHTVGTEKIVFAIKHEHMLIENVFGCNSYDIIKDSVKDINGIDMNRKVASNVVYLAITYVMHKIIRSTLPQALKDKSLRDLYFIMAFKMVTSLYYRYYPEPFNKAKAKMVYEKLSNNFLIKKLGNWFEVYKYRADNELELHYDRLQKLDINVAMIFIADVQNRWRRMLVELNKVLYNMVDSEYAMNITSLLTTDEEKGMVFSDTKLSSTAYTDKLADMLHKPEFVNKDLAYLISVLSVNVSIDVIFSVVLVISDPDSKYHKEVEELVPLIIEMSFIFIKKSGLDINNKDDIEDIIIELRNMWSGSRRKEPQVIKVRMVLETIISDTGIKISQKAIKPMANLLPVYMFLLVIQ